MTEGRARTGNIKSIYLLLPAYRAPMHHCLWQVELLQLPQEVHPLLSSFGEGADVQLPLEVLGDDGAQEAEGLRLGSLSG